MKKFLLTIGSLMVMLLTTLAAPAFAADGDYCWKDSYGRGVGTVPQACAAGRDRIGLLCYSKCGANMKRFGFDCHSVCPSGMRDDGLFCRAAEYGRGAGYPWKFGDALNDNGMIARCERDNGKGKCEKNGLIYYPKCKPGYHNVGCCICRPNVPNCSALGMNPGIDLSCAKKITIGDPVPGVCASGQQYDAGLCYSNCKTAYNGVGPVCWGTCPTTHPVNCGAGCAKTQSACASNTTDQVLSVLEVVANVALAVGTGGASTAATTGAKAGATAAKTSVKTGAKFAAKITKQEAIAIIKKQAKEAGKELAQSTIETMAEATVQAGTTGEFDPEILAGLDPTGIASVVVAYAKPVCSPPAAGTTPPATRGGTAPTKPATPAATGGKLSWVAGPAVPASAVIGGQETGRSLPVCRASHQGGVHPGKVVAGKCNIGWGGREITLPSFEVLTNGGATLAWVAGPAVPANAVIGGQETGRSLPICRGSHQGGVHPGKVVAGKCNIGWGGRELTLTRFEVLTQK